MFNFKITLNRERFKEFILIFYKMYHSEVLWFDYLQFYNLSKVRNKLSEMNGKIEFSNKKNHVLILTPNEYDNFIHLVNCCYCSDGGVLSNLYHQSIIIEVLADLNKQKENYSHRLKMLTQLNYEIN